MSDTTATATTAAAEHNALNSFGPGETKIVTYPPGKCGLILDRHKVVKIDPKGRTKKDGLIKLGDFVVKVEVEGETAATKCGDILDLLKLSNTTRVATFFLPGNDDDADEERVVRNRGEERVGTGDRQSHRRQRRGGKRKATSSTGRKRKNDNDDDDDDDESDFISMDIDGLQSATARGSRSVPDIGNDALIESKLRSILSRPDLDITTATVKSIRGLLCEDFHFDPRNLTKTHKSNIKLILSRIMNEETDDGDETIIAAGVEAAAAAAAVGRDGDDPAIVATVSNRSRKGQSRRFKISDDDDGIDMLSDEASRPVASLIARRHDVRLHDAGVGFNHGGDNDEDAVSDAVVGVNQGGDGVASSPRPSGLDRSSRTGRSRGSHLSGKRTRSGRDAAVVEGGIIRDFVRDGAAEEGGIVGHVDTPFNKDYHGDDANDDCDAGRTLLTANEKKSDNVIITILYMLQLQGHPVTLAEILRRKTKDKLNQGDYDSAVNRLVEGQYIEIKRGKLQRYAITEKGSDRYNKTMKQKRQFQHVRIDEENLTPEDQVLLKMNKKRFFQRTDFLLKLQSTMRIRGIDDDELTGMTEDDFLTMDASNPDRLIDVLTSEWIRSSLDKKIKDSLGVTSVDATVRKDILFSAYAEMMADEENEDEHEEEIQDMETDDDDDDDDVEETDLTDVVVDSDVGEKTDPTNEEMREIIDTRLVRDKKEGFFENQITDGSYKEKNDYTGVTKKIKRNNWVATFGHKGKKYSTLSYKNKQHAVRARSIMIHNLTGQWDVISKNDLNEEMREMIEKQLVKDTKEGFFENQIKDGSYKEKNDYTGVKKKSKRNNWVATFGHKGKQYSTLSYKNKQHAVRARSIMSHNLTGQWDFISKYDMNVQNFNCDCGHINCMHYRNPPDIPSDHNHTKLLCITKAGLCGILKPNSQVQFDDLLMEQYLQPSIEKYQKLAETAKEIGMPYNILDRLYYDIPGETSLTVGLNDWNPKNFLDATKRSLPLTKFGHNLEQRIVTELSQIDSGFTINKVYNNGSAAIRGIHTKIVRSVTDKVAGISPSNRLSIATEQGKRKRQTKQKTNTTTTAFSRRRQQQLRNIHRRLHTAVENHKLSLIAYHDIIKTTFDPSCICKTDPKSRNCKAATDLKIRQQLKIKDMNRKILAKDFLRSGVYGILHATLIDPLGENWKPWSPSESEKDVKGVLMSRGFLQSHFNLTFDQEAKKLDNNVWASFSLEGCLRHIQNKKFKNRKIPDDTKIYLAVITSVSPFFDKFQPHYITGGSISSSHETMVRTRCQQVVPDHWLVKEYKQNSEWKELPGYVNQSNTI